MINGIFPRSEVPSIWIIILGTILIIPITLVLGAISNNVLKAAVLVLIPLLILFFFNFKLSFSFLVLLLFADVHRYGFAAVEYFSIFLLLSFFVNYNNIEIKDFKSPVFLFFVIFLMSCIPSIITTEVLPHLIYEAVITKSRTFGFAGVMFVDYVGIAIVVVFIWFLLSGIQKKIFLLPILLILILASVFTQTRNSWISIVILILLILSFFYFHSRRYELNKRFLLVITLLMSISIGGVYSYLKGVTPSVSERVEQFSETNNEVVNQKGEVTSSLISRLFIWDTALNAFTYNPVTGVGIYGFPYISWKYYKIPKIFFNNYVVSRTPHIAYLAIATEAGIIGLIGYLLFIFSIIKFSYQSIKLSKSHRDNLLSIVLFFCIIYITVSMLMTDAWLWNQGIVLWGIILSLSMVNRKILLERYSSET